MATWNLDRAHTEVGFSVRHMMVSTVRGRFTDFEANVHIDEEHPDASRVGAVIQAASLDTGAEDRDAHLRSPDFFDVEQYPEIRFESTRVTQPKDGRVSVEGNLTIKDVTRPVTLQGEFHGPATSPWGQRAVGFELTAELDREAFGLTWNQALEAGGVLVGKTVKLQIGAEVNAAVEALT
ncbi:MAG: hypothetical protein GEU80_12200 [Dehalococcoidia bacterium]|nr:hypothetical protein [Dehalococcoidia bacterium]